MRPGLEIPHVGLEQEDCDDDHQIMKSQPEIINVAEPVHLYLEAGFCPYLSIPSRRIFDSRV